MITIDHYKRAPETSFDIQDRSSTTILFNGLSVTADRFFESALTGMGYNIKALPVPNMEAMARGKEFCDTGLCNPTYFTIGNLIAYLEQLCETGLTKDEIVENYVFLTAGSCGPCRFGMYEYEYRYALENSGFAGFRVIVFQMAGSINQAGFHSGLRMDFEFFRTMLNSVILSDHLNELRYQIKPYEVHAGQTEQVIQQCSQWICDYLKTKKSLRPAKLSLTNDPIAFETIRNLKDQWVTPELNKVLKKCKKLIKTIEVDYNRVRPIVKVIGEFWAQTTEGDGNYRIFNFLEEEGCEIIVEPVSYWVTYLLWLSKHLSNERSLIDQNGRVTLKTPFKYMNLLSKKLITKAQYNTADFLFKREYRKIGKKLGNKNRPLKSIAYFARLSEKYIDRNYEGGEGFLEVAKNIYFTKNSLAHMVLSIKPFGCMPSTISDSVQIRVMSDYEKMLFLPLETSGEGKINALSRVQMVLSEARQRATREYENCVEKILEKNPVSLKDKKYPMKALDHLPQVKGVTLKAARYMHANKKKLRSYARRKEAV